MARIVLEKIKRLKSELKLERDRRKVQLTRERRKLQLTLRENKQPRSRTDTAGKPPPIAANSPTVYYLNGKVQRNGGMFRAFKYFHSVQGVAEFKKDKMVI